MSKPNAAYPVLCPVPETLGKLLREELEPNEAELAEKHVAACPGCQLVLDRLIGGLPDMLTSVLVGHGEGADETPLDLPGYEILEELGRGGMGVVYKARQIGLNRLVALKMILTGAGASPQARARFHTEAVAAGRLQHPHIIQIYDIGDHRGQPYYSQELVEGGTLAQKLASQPQPAGEAARLVETLARAAYHAHQQGIIHRDLKPANILLTVEGTPKIRDFGLAKSLEEDSTQSRLQPATPRDLETICLQCLAKEPPKRYPSARELADDLTRFRAGKPIKARPVHALEHGWRWCRRNPVPAALLACVALLLVVIAAGASLAARRLQRERDRAVGYQLAAEQQRQIAEDNEQKAIAAAELEKRAKQTAQTREAETKAVLEFVEKKVLAAARPKGQEGGLGREVTLRKAVEAALPFLENGFVEQPLIEARLRMTLGWSYWYLGDARVAADQFQAARTLYVRHLGPDHPDTLLSMNKLSNSYFHLGRHAEALKLHEETLMLRQAKLGPDHPDTLWSMNNVAACYFALGRHTEALKLHEETLATRRAKLGPDHPDTLVSMTGLAIDYSALGRHTEALGLHKKTLALQTTKLGPHHQFTLRTMHCLGGSYAALGRHTEALKLREETLALQKAKLGHDHPDTLRSMVALASSYADLGWQTDALKLHEETLALRKTKLGARHPDTLFSMGGVATSLIKLKRGVEAIPIIDECLRRAAESAAVPRFSGLADERLRYFEKTRDAAGCRTTAELWEKLNCTDPGSFYNAARYRAVTAAVLRAAGPSPVAAQLANLELGLAMTWLQKAVAAGYKDVGHIKRDTDLDVLRDGEDFRKLLAELEAGKPREGH